MRRLRTILLGLLAAISCFLAVLLTNIWTHPAVSVTSSSQLLQPLPTQPIGYYDYFGDLLSPAEAAALVQSKGLDPARPISYARIGAVHITQNLIDQGKEIFFDRTIGDTFGLQRVLGFRAGERLILPETTAAIQALNGAPTSNLHITLQKDIILGSHVFPAGTEIPLGLDVEANSLEPIGLKIPSFNITCALCHVSLSDAGEQLQGVPNGDLEIPFLIALAPNSAAGFARLNLNPLDPNYQGAGKTIIDSQGNWVTLPDPVKFEQAMDDEILFLPTGHFESSPDGINNTTQIPPVFTFQAGPFTADGGFAVGPFAGLSAINNAVHSSEVNLLAAAQLSQEALGIDPEVYLGTVLQNAADPRLRLPDGDPVQPSVWLRQVAPDPTVAELEDQIPAPGTGTYPNLKPSLFTYNGLVFSPNTGQRRDVASGPFLYAANAMAAWQNTLLPPANRTLANRQAITSGSVARGATVFEQANCLSCHKAPFFTDNQIHPLAEIQSNSARAQSRLGLDAILVPPFMYSLSTPVPPPSNAEILEIPTAGISDTPTTLPKNILPDGGYKTPSLLGLHATAPYLHDGGVAARQGTLQQQPDGSYQVIDPSGLGLNGTLSQSIPADSAESLRILLDRNLRVQAIAANQSNPDLVLSNLDGTGHEFYVDGDAGFTPEQQTDLVNFLLAIDDNTGQY